MQNTTAIILKGCCKISDFYNLGRSPTDRQMPEATRGVVLKVLRGLLLKLNQNQKSWMEVPGTQGTKLMC